MRPRKLTALALLALAQCEFSCSLTDVSREKLEAELTTWLTSEGLPPTKVTCPDGQRLEKGNRFECQVDFDGVEAIYEVEVTDPMSGAVEWKAKHAPIVGDKLEGEILALPELAGRKTAECPPVLVSVPQSKWQCKIDESSTFAIEFSDSTGKYAWTLDGDRVSGAKLEAELAKWLKDNDLEATASSCPTNEKLIDGHTFECTCTVAGVEVPIAVEVVDEAKGTVEWKPKYTTVKGSDLETSVPKLPELAGRTLSVDCPTVLVSVPQSKWKCDATDKAAGDAAMVLELTFSDGAGTYDWTLTPKPSP